MISRVSGEPAIVLHSRPYRETSSIVSLLTLHHGRVVGVVKGARGRRRANIFQPFNTVNISWTGRGGMVTLTRYEAVTHPWLKGDEVAAAFYVVELVTRLVGEHESLPRLYGAVAWVIESLEVGRPSLETVLRSFEKLMLEELGYGLDFAHEADSGKPLSPERKYRLQPDRGFVLVGGDIDGNDFSGAVLLDIGAEDFASSATRRAAKWIFRHALAAHLGPKPLTSRRLLFHSRS